MNRGFLSISDIFSALGGNAEVARAIGVGPSTASEMKRRGRIPVEYWRALIRLAKAKGVSEVDAEMLVRLHARKEPESTVLERPFEDSPAPAGHFSRFKGVRRSHFTSGEEITAHLRALREEWERR